MEPRAFTRVLVRIDASLRTSSGHEIQGLVRDLSLKGIGIEGAGTMAPGEECVIRIFLATGTEPIPIRLAGTVVRNEDGVVAATFSGVAAEDVDHLEKLVQYNAPDPLAFEEEAVARSAERPTVQSP